MKDIREIIKKIDALKPMPQVAQKVMAIAKDPQSSMADLSEIIIYDQALTANVLKLCNSALFGLPNKVESVQQAIVYLGMDQIVDLVLISGGASNLKGKHEGYDLEEGELWRYSVASSLIARDLAEIKKAENVHLIFTSALVKDIGKVILNQYVADSYEKIKFLVSKHGFSFKEAEKAVIGIDHAELGGLVAEKWNFSSKMIEIIRYHHSPSEAKESSFETCLVHLADSLCMMMGIGVGSDGLSYRFDRDAAEQLGFSERDFQEIIAGFGEKIQKVEELINAV
ncbi:MAG: HDOD domain-containing protein [Deltaproteobacteria bacterium]|nr:HDOD domain-containing protein [Deltaproteobacteria bacterium]MBW2017370.1 HDOD domain-containing protein [Deltaproteobacteria bacterium]MBW2128226.1 HDOD domain-containing protein [Deltaproteobacteria bacterium]MBW2303244.1 HDOD domain-containing protein [Deltaproteobacteria bacterium]